MSTINIFILYPNKVLKELVVIMNDSIESVKRCIDIKNMVFIYDGVILHPKMTFKFYNIPNNANILMVNRCNNDICNKWKAISMDKDEMEAKKMYFLDESFKKSCSIINNIRLHKIENKNTLFRKLLRNSFPNNSNPTKLSNNQTVIPAQDLEGPSIEPLPLIF